MQITYTWRILGVNTYTEYQGQADVIFACQWELTGTTENGASAWVWDRIGFTCTPHEGWIARHQVTEDTLIGWVQDELGEQRIGEIKMQIEQMLNQPIA